LKGKSQEPPLLELELLEELELLDELELEEELQSSITPPLPDCWLLQVLVPMQLALSSQPQPLV